jgi:hypothetical protein
MQPAAKRIVARDAHFALVLMLVAFVTRVIAAISLERWLISRGGDGFLGLDDRGYDQIAWQQAQAWLGVGPGVAPGDRYLLNAYTYINAGVYFAVGHHSFAMKLLNCLLGALVAGLVLIIARCLFGHLAGAFAGIAAAFFPSTFLWSLTSLKETMFLFAVALVMWLVTVLLATGSWRLVLPLLTAFALVGSLRSYVQVMLGVLIPGTVILQGAARLPRKWPLAAILAAGCVVLLWFSGGLRWLGVGVDQVNVQRECAAYGANSAYAPSSDVPCSLGMSAAGEGVPANVELVDQLSIAGSVRDLAAWLPIGLWHVLAAPFPWSASSMAERATIPEMLAWYAALVLAVVAVAHHWRQWRDYAHLLGLIGGILLVLALTQGNLGTLVRHRGMVIPFVLIFSGAGAAWLWPRWRPLRSVPRFVRLDRLTSRPMNPS